VTRRAWYALGVGLGLAVIAAAAFYLLRGKPAPRLTLAAARYDQLIGWREDRLAAAIPALQRSCAALLTRADDAVLEARNKATDFGKIAEWRGPCTAAGQLPAGDDAAARQFFEANFAPYLAGNNGESAEKSTVSAIAIAEAKTASRRTAAHDSA